MTGQPDFAAIHERWRAVEDATTGVEDAALRQPTIVDWDNYCTRTVAAGAEWSELEIRFEDLRQAGWGEVRLTLQKRVQGLCREIASRRIFAVIPGPSVSPAWAGTTVDRPSAWRR